MVEPTPENKWAKTAGTFSNWVIAQKIAFATLVRSTGNPARDAQCLEFSRRQLLLHNDAARTNYLEGNDIDAIFLSAYSSGYNYVLVQAAGHYLLDKPGVRDRLEKELGDDLFFLCHILDQAPLIFLYTISAFL